jgi:hypothetical protein
VIYLFVFLLSPTSSLLCYMCRYSMKCSALFCYVSLLLKQNKEGNSTESNLNFNAPSVSCDFQIGCNAQTDRSYVPWILSATERSKLKSACFLLSWTRIGSNWLFRTFLIDGKLQKLQFLFRELYLLRNTLLVTICTTRFNKKRRLMPIKCIWYDMVLYDIR